MTIEERLAALEEKTQFITIIYHHDPAFGVIPGMYFHGCRFGFNTEYHMHKDKGKGAQASFGNAFDWCCIYVENEDIQGDPDKPSVAIYAAALAGGKQPNIAFQGIVGNASDKGGVSQNYGLYLDMGANRILTLQREGIQLMGSWANLLIGKVGAALRTIWP